MSARTRRRLARASFGPEWAPFGGMANWLLYTCRTPRDRVRMYAHLRDARRGLASLEAVYDKAAERELQARSDSRP